MPGGGAPYPSSLIMTVVPAQVAGVGRIVVASPADRDGTVDPVLAGAAGLLGVETFLVAGGAQAIGALAFGLPQIGLAPVDRIVGPGNAWVTAAKLEVAGEVAIDLPAGPSEGLVLADAHADPRTVAADLITQAEHGPDSPAILVTTDEALADAVEVQVNERLATALRRASSSARSRSTGGSCSHATWTRPSTSSMRTPPSTCRSTSPISRRRPPGSPTRAPCSSAAGRPSRRVTMRPARTMCCRPAASRARAGPSLSRRSGSSSRSSALTREGLATPATDDPRRSPRPKGCMPTATPSRPASRRAMSPTPSPTRSRRCRRATPGKPRTRRSRLATATARPHRPVRPQHVADARRRSRSASWRPDGSRRSLSDYPPGDYGRLTRAAADTYGVGTDELVVGAGADEILDLCAKAFLPPNGAAIVPTPTTRCTAWSPSSVRRRLVAIAAAAGRRGLDHGRRRDPCGCPRACRR